MSYHRFLHSARHLHKAKYNFLPTHTATRRKYHKPTEDHVNVNPLTGERINPTDGADYVDIHHKIVVSTLPSYANKLDSKFGSGDYATVNIYVHPSVKDLSTQDLWRIHEDTLGGTQWYRPLTVKPHIVEGILVRHEIELEPIVGNKFGDEDF